MTKISRRPMLQDALGAGAASTMLARLNGPVQARGSSSSGVPYCELVAMEQLSGWRSPIDDRFLPVLEGYEDQTHRPDHEAEIMKPADLVGGIRRRARPNADI